MFAATTQDLHVVGEQVSRESVIDGWRAVLVERTSLASGVLHLTAPLVYLFLTGQAFTATPLFLAIGVGQLAAMGARTGSRGRWPSVRDHAALLTASLALTVMVLGWLRGPSPIFVSVSSGLVALACLLVTRWAAFALVAGIFGWTLAMGGVSPTAAHPSASVLVDPYRMAHWVEVSTFFALINGALVLILRRAASLVSDSYRSAQHARADAELHLDAVRRGRAARVEAERALRAQHKIQAVAQFSRGLAHLVNNALMVVRGALDVLRDDKTASRREQAASHIIAATHRAAAAVRELMMFARADDATPGRLDLLSEVAATVGGIGAALSEDVRVHVQGAPGLLVEIERDRLRQVVANLVLNASDALPAGGEVRLTARPIPGKVGEPSIIELVVEDDGAGMTAEQVAGATDAFFTTRDSECHAGLGLTVAVGIAEQAGGSLQLESAPGVGTRVRVRLPGFVPGRAEHVGPLLHTRPLRAKESVPPVVASLPPETSSEAWRDDATTRIARWMAIIGALVAVVTVLSGMNNVLARALGLVVPAIVAGWAPLRSQRLRLLLLTSGAFVVALSIVMRLSYLSAGSLALLVATVIWSTLLGPRWAGPAVVAGASLALLGIGLLWSTGGDTGNLAQVSLEQPGNLVRMSVIVGFLHSVMAASVLAIIDQARRGVAEMEHAEVQLMAARAEEERQTVAVLAVEREESRSARVAATGRAIGTVVHDLSNALHGLTSCAELLRIGGRSQEEADELIAELWQAYEYARAVVTQFAVRDEGPVTPPPLDIGVEAQRIMRMMPSIVRSTIRIESSLATGSFVRIADSDLRRLLFNLVTNARDAVQSAGTIKITVSAAGGRVTLVVGDSGHGMSEQVRARLFEPFFTTKPPGRGTGLGLYSVARIVSHSGGEIAIDSRPGHGATFTISWPEAIAPDASPPLRSEDDVASGMATGTVIVAEDDAMVRAMMVRVLTRSGYTVCDAADGDAALQLIDQTPECVAMCIDGVMPGAPTADVIAAFTHRNPGRPVIVCTGYRPAAMEQRGILGPNVRVITKPFDPRLLHELIAGATPPEDAEPGPGGARERTAPASG